MSVSDKSNKGCMLCPRKCGADRKAGRTGFCGVTDKIKIARAALHFWEEPCISGKEGSGAVFFSGCTLRCVFCQNREISVGAKGCEVSIDKLVDIFFDLQEQGANNINLVTAGQFAPAVAEAIGQYKAKCVEMGFVPLPFVYNTSSYEDVETLKLFDGLVDVYLPDLKYLDDSRAEKYSKAADYPDVAKKAIAEMVRQVGELSFDERGMIKKGVIVRHLVLPLGTREAERVISYLYDTYGDNIMISIMSQYTPLSGVEEKFSELGRRITKREYEKVVKYATDLGVTNAFIQERKVAKESFIPDFNQSF